MCDLITSGRTLACNDQLAGVRHIDFAVYDEYGFVVAANAIAALPVSLTEVFRYEVKGSGNNLTETAAISQDNGTTVITAVVNGVLVKLGAATQTQAKAIISGRSIAFVRDENDNVHVVGINGGLTGVSGVKQTGGAAGDLTGYNFSIQAMDKNYSPMLAPAAITALNALVSDTVVTP